MKKVKLSEKIQLPEKYKAKTVNWLTGIPQHIKIRQRQERECRRMELEDLGRPPEPGYGLDGYPLQEGKKYVANRR